MQTKFIQVLVGKKKLNCVLENGTPYVEHRKKTYGSLQTLTTALPELLAPDHVEEFARIANFLSSGMEYVVIEDIPAFQRNYRRRIWQEKSSMSHTLPRLSDFGVFNLNGLRDPDVIDGTVVFYVEQNGTGVPYKATFSTSPNATEEKVSYSMLPEATE